MRKLIIALSLLCLVGCASKTPFGKCIGLNGEKDPTLVYEYSTNNIVVAVIFAETIIVPVEVLLNEISCPIGVKNVK